MAFKAFSAVMSLLVKAVPRPISSVPGLRGGDHHRAIFLSSKQARQCFWHLENEVERPRKASKQPRNRISKGLYEA